MPDSSIIPDSISSNYLQTMLAHMLFNEKTYYVKPLTATNLVLNQFNSANISASELGSKLCIDGVIRYDFFDFIKSNNKIKGFIFSLSLLDCKRGKVVWQTVCKLEGKEDKKHLNALKKLIKTKLTNKSNMPFFVELYHSLKKALHSLNSPIFSEDELTQRLLNTTDPF